jgi:three-Cys-motif partner protein
MPKCIVVKEVEYAEFFRLIVSMNLLANFVSMQSSFHVPQISSSTVKSTIVSTYFMQWTKMVAVHAKKAGNKIGFLDFFSGSGKDDDGSETAPLLVLKSAVECEEVGNMLVPVFCDKDAKNIIKLRQSVAHLNGLEKLAYGPRFEKGISYDDLISSMQKIRLLPSLFVIDPFHVKDLNLDLFSTHIKEGNIDCIFQIPYTLLEKMIDNPFKVKHLEMVFGKSAADKLRTVADRLNSQQKECFIINTFLGAMKSLRGYHSIVLHYSKGGDVYYLVFITRYVLRYRFMKEVMIINGYHETGVSHHELGQAVKSNLSVQAGLFN